MSDVKIIGPAVPNVPWQEPPAEMKGAPVWRYSENPVIGRNPIKEVARIFNSAVMPYEDGFIGVFRAEQTNGIPYIYLGRSKDAIHWEFDEEKIQFEDEDGNPFMPVYAYDPRLVKVEDTYYIMWCQDFYGASIGRLMASLCFFPVQATADIHHLVIYLFQKALIWFTGAGTAM